MKKYNEKGFTLIELLAVIAILAIIALITTPAILNVIEDARVQGTQDKAWGTIDAVKQTYSQASLKQNYNDASNVATFPSASIGGTSVQMSGDKPTSGTVTINRTTGVITALNLKFEGNGTYYCSTNTAGTKMCCKKTTVTAALADLATCNNK